MLVYAQLGSLVVGLGSLMAADLGQHHLYTPGNCSVYKVRRVGTYVCTGFLSHPCLLVTSYELPTHPPFTSTSTNPAMQYHDTPGSHGGEAMLVSSHLHAIPIDPVIIDAALAANDQMQRWAAVEVRLSKCSILFINAYFWDGERLSSRNFAILQQIYYLVFAFGCAFF